MDSECTVCYSADANCKLVCKHAFCKGCVKEWYHKSEDPTCPMCRRAMYFKGMHKVVNEWEQERADKRNEDVFSQAFDEIFEEDDSDDESYVTMESDTESDAGSDDSWETWDEELLESEVVTRSDVLSPTTVPAWSPKDCYSNFMLEEIRELQKDYQKAMEMGMDFDVYLENLEYYYIEPPSKTSWIEDDVFPHFKNLFVSNHKNMIRNKRLGARVPSKNYMGFTFVVLVLC